MNPVCSVYQGSETWRDGADDKVRRQPSGVPFLFQGKMEYQG